MYTDLTNHTNPEEDLMKANSLLSNPFYLKMKYCFSRKKFRLYPNNHHSHCLITADE